MLHRTICALALLLAPGCINVQTASQTSANVPVSEIQTSASESVDKVTNPYVPKRYVQLQHPEWATDAVLYQINTRQFTPEGTFKAAEAQQPRLKELGVDILWLMPIHPIGEVNRKGTLGSPYSVNNYF